MTANSTHSASDGKSNLNGINGFVPHITRGAGGNGRTINEVKDAIVIRQSSSMNCGAACGEMLLRTQGVFVSQAAMLFEAGARFGHWVCVLGLDHAGRVMILDPADGTRSIMEIKEFMAHWT